MKSAQNESPGAARPVMAVGRTRDSTLTQAEVNISHTNTARAIIASFGPLAGEPLTHVPCRTAGFTAKGHHMSIDTVAVFQVPNAELREQLLR